jgi:hypothetical protein
VNSVADYVTVSIDMPIRELPVQERLWVALERQTANNAHRKMLCSAARVMRAIAQRRAVSNTAALRARTIVALQRLFHFFTPARMQLSDTRACAPVHYRC